MLGGVAPKFGSEKVSRYTGVSQLQLRVSRYTVQLRLTANGLAFCLLLAAIELGTCGNHRCGHHITHSTKPYVTSLSWG